MKAVIQLFTQCRNRQSTVTETGSPQAEESAPVQMMHDIILDLLSDVPESMMAEAPLPDVSTLPTLKAKSGHVLMKDSWRHCSERSLHLQSSVRRIAS